MKITDTPTLQAPGAGLPWWEHFIARYLLFPMTCRIQYWPTASRLFQQEGARILAIWDALPSEQVTRRVLIRRIAGMEDSSRFWSVAMTVEHLNIVNEGVRWVLTTMWQGGNLDRQVNTADFKPKGLKESAEIRAAFAASLAEAAMVDQKEPAIPGSKDKRHEHPWFGPLDAHQWNCLRSFHQTIHRKQVEAIQKGLGTV